VDRRGPPPAFPGEEGDGFQAGDDPSTTQIEIVVDAASPTIISASLAISQYSGGAHGSYNSRVILWSLSLDRALTASDLFADPKGQWLRLLLDRRYHADRQHDGCDRPDPVKTLPELTHAGMTFTFDLGGYPCGGQVAVSWADLDRFLKRPLPLRPDLLVDLAQH
jgi:hypothetical protein